jgi:hypothetical protein
MNDKQKQFIQLRADGLSFDKIGVQLKTSKPTLIQWSRIYKDELNDMKFQSLADLKEQYRFNQRAKYEQLLKHLQKIDDTITTLPFENSSIKDLMMVRNDITSQLESIEKRTSFIQTGLTSRDKYTGENEQIAVKLNEIE